jgi:exonuclease-1
MGARNLFPLAAPVSHLVSLRQYSGRAVGLDGDQWLLSALRRHPFGPPEVILQDLSHRLDNLVNFGIFPFFVFSGATLPTKRKAADFAAQVREGERQRAAELTDHAFLNEAFGHWVNSIPMTYSAIRIFTERLRRRCIRFLVAPAEASAQLCYLARIGEISAIFTDNPEIFLFHPVCPVLSGFLNASGQVTVVLFSDFLAHLELEFPDFVALCVLSGTSLLERLSKYGLVGTLRLARKYDTIPQFVLSELNLTRSALDQLEIALIILKYIKVYDPRSGVMVTLQKSDYGFAFLGPEFRSIHELTRFVSGETDPASLPIGSVPTEPPFRILISELPRGLADSSPTPGEGTPAAQLSYSSAAVERELLRKERPEVNASILMEIRAERKNPTAVPLPRTRTHAPAKPKRKSSAVSPTALSLRSAAITDFFQPVPRPAVRSK